jgi:hypothetical protein
MKHVYVNFPYTIAKALVSGFLASRLTWSRVGHVVTVCMKFWKYNGWVGFSSIMFVACFVKSISLKVNRRTHTHARTHHGDLINPLICCKEKIWTETPLFPGSCGFLTFRHRVLHLIQINHQPDATVFQFIILTFVYSSTCFGRFFAHHQELIDCSGSLWFYLRIVVIVVLPLQSLNSWWWAGKRPKHVEL